MPFGKHQDGDFKYIHAGSIKYTTHLRPINASSKPAASASSSSSRLSAPPRHGAEGKHGWKCEICNLFFTSSQALGGHKATSQEHRERMTRQEIQGVRSQHTHSQHTSSQDRDTFEIQSELDCLRKIELDMNQDLDLQRHSQDSDRDVKDKKKKKGADGKGARAGTSTPPSCSWLPQQQQQRQPLPPAYPPQQQQEQQAQVVQGVGFSQASSLLFSAQLLSKMGVDCGGGMGRGGGVGGVGQEVTTGMHLPPPAWPAHYLTNSDFLPNLHLPTAVSKDVVLDVVLGAGAATTAVSTTTAPTMWRSRAARSLELKESLSSDALPIATTCTIQGTNASNPMSWPPLPIANGLSTPGAGGSAGAVAECAGASASTSQMPMAASHAAPRHIVGGLMSPTFAMPINPLGGMNAAHTLFTKRLGSALGVSVEQGGGAVVVGAAGADSSFASTAVAAGVPNAHETVGNGAKVLGGAHTVPTAAISSFNTSNTTKSRKRAREPKQEKDAARDGDKSVTKSKHVDSASKR